MPRSVRRSLLLVVLPAVAAAQGAPGDAARGRSLYETFCARCHGIDGAGDLGANLRRPTLRRAPDDDALVALILSGIADRGMPATFMLGPGDARLLAAHVRSLGRVAPERVDGDPVRGRALFEGKGGCPACHIVRGVGGSLGPDLSEVGIARGSVYIRQALTDPGASLPRGPLPGSGTGSLARFLPVRVTTSDGRTVTGMRISEDGFSIQLRDANNRLHSFTHAEIRRIDRQFGTSMMPAFHRVFTAAELQDVVAWLTSLRGGPS